MYLHLYLNNLYIWNNCKLHIDQDQVLNLKCILDLGGIREYRTILLPNYTARGYPDRK